MFPFCAQRQLEAVADAEPRVETRQVRLDAVCLHAEDPPDLGSGSRLQDESDYVTLATRELNRLTHECVGAHVDERARTASG